MLQITEYSLNLNIFDIDITEKLAKLRKCLELYYNDNIITRLILKLNIKLQRYIYTYTSNIIYIYKKNCVKC